MHTPEHPIFQESIRFIREQLGLTGLSPLQNRVLERLIHSSGDFGLKSLISFSAGACEVGLSSLEAGAPILTDTKMASAAVTPMVMRTNKSLVRCVLDWAPEQVPYGSTRTSLGMRKAWIEMSDKFQGDQSPIVLIGSSPTALDTLLELVQKGAASPSLIIGMPVGFIGVLESKSRLAKSDIPQIRLDGSRGGAGLVAAAANALLSSCYFEI